MYNKLYDYYATCHMEAFRLARQKSELLCQQAQESAQYPPDPFPRERVGSGNETSVHTLIGFGYEASVDNVDS